MKKSQYNILTALSNDKYVLFNTRTGCSVSLTKNRKEEYEKLPSKSIISNNSFNDFLKSYEFIINSDVDEISLIKTNFHNTINTLDKLTITVALTENCNLRCVYCYQKHDIKENDNNVKFTFMKVLKLLDEKKIKHLHINWFGGEPILKLKLIEELYSFAKKECDRLKINLVQHITSNGTLLNSNIVNKLSKIGINQYQITIDGEEEQHNKLRPMTNSENSYKNVLNGCKSILLSGAILLIRINVTKIIADKIDLLIDDLVKIGATPKNTIFHIVRAIDHTFDKTNTIFYTNKEFAKIWILCLKKIKKYGFSIPHLNPLAFNCSFDSGKAIYIDYNGNYGSCTSVPSKKKEKVNKMGGEKIEINMRNDDFFKTECKKCLYLPSCVGGCQYLEENGQEKCIPEKYVFKELISLTY